MNTPILIIFFNRPYTLQKVFDQVKKVKPSKLYLAQDGARIGNEKDLENIAKCREIVGSIDWQCEVMTDYSEVNLGCGVRPMSAISWVLSHEDRLIILEDDCVPNPSFFGYCEELLERYNDDQRVCYISGLNHFVEWDCGGYDYCFTKTGSIHGWATWKRAWNLYDYHVEKASDPYYLRLLKDKFYYKKAFDIRKQGWEKAYKSKTNNEKLSFWDIQWGFVKYSQNSLVIVPRINLITNIGTDANSTHTALNNNEKFVPGKTFIRIPSGALNLPLKHPSIMVCDDGYDRKVEKSMYSTSFFNKIKGTVKKILRGQ